MNNNTELNRLEEALRNDTELQKKLEETRKRIAESGEAKNDGEVMVKAAAELGFSITIEDLERAKAAAEELCDDELNNVAGGVETFLGNNVSVDDKGHDNWCFTAWHCFATTLQTETTTHSEACWKDYVCAFISKGGYLS